MLYARNKILHVLAVARMRMRMMNTVLYYYYYLLHFTLHTQSLRLARLATVDSGDPMSESEAVTEPSSL